MNEKISFSAPASKWEEALPIGNGSLGAMIYGGVKKNTVQLNEITLWSGAPFVGADRENAYTHLDELRGCIEEKKYDKAAEILDSEFTNFGGGFEGAYSGSYQTLGELKFNFAKASDVTDYRRELDIADAICTELFYVNGVHYTREYFASHPDRLIAMRFSADFPGAVTFGVAFSRLDTDDVTYRDDGIVFSGHCDGDKSHMAFAGRLFIDVHGGAVRPQKNKIKVINADEAILYFTAATDYVPDASADFKGNDPCKTVCSRKMNYDYNEIKRRHVNDFREHFDKCVLDLKGVDKEAETTAERLNAMKKGKSDNGMAELFFNYGRYLLLSCSRSDNLLPANLQGLWCKDYKAPWHSDYHTNINVQMNYWCASPANIGECNVPLNNFICALTQNGAKTAKAYYNARGWTLYTISNPWFWTSPGWGGGWSQYPLGGAWMCRHLVEYFNYTGDKLFLEKVYPVLRDNCLFNTDILYKDKDGRYMTCPATSPENSFVDDDGNSGWVCKGTAMDIEMLWENFTDMIRICDILGKDPELVVRLKELRDGLAPLCIGKAGQLCEWGEDWDLNSREMHHRHVSHLYGLHPGTMISWEKTPELAQAAKRSLELRGDDGTGWSLAWKINFAARLHDGDHALRLINRLLDPMLVGRRFRRHGGGVYPNLFDAHPPFQIDGNFGAVSGICEMLMQSHVLLNSGEFLIDILPALPSDWRNGEVKGLVARGNTEVGIRWCDGMAERITVKSRIGGRVAVKGSYVSDKDFEYIDGITYINAEPGVEYVLAVK